MDILTIIGLAMGIGAVVGGQVLEGGSIHAISQGTAAIIVFGGTIGAVLVQYPLSTVLLALRNLKVAFFSPSVNPTRTIRMFAEYAAVARKEGLLALEAKVRNVRDPFLKKGLQLVVDGSEPRVTREILEIDMAYSEEYHMTSARVFESAGGYSPTIGIIGAVLGLIHVMENLSDPELLGAGIAVAFVATVYGVASANLVYLPLAGKIKSKIRESTIMKEMVVEGVIALSEGENPRSVEEKLNGFLRDTQKKG